MSLLRFYRPIPVRCMMVIVGVFLVAFVAGYRFAPQLGKKEWFTGHPPVNFRDTPYVPIHTPLSEQHQAFLHIFTYNTLATAQILSFGTVIFLFSFFRIAMVGCPLGVAFWYLGSPWLWARFFLPHALVELPVLFYAGAISMNSGLRWLVGGPEGRWRILKRELAANLKLFLLLIPFVIFAALLEAYVTNRW